MRRSALDRPSGHFARVLCASVLALIGSSISFAQPTFIGALATQTGKIENKAPAWTKGGVYVYRLATPDEPNVLPFIEQEFAITNHLLDGSIQQIPIVMGLIGHDHPGKCNWDGLWPYWGRVTYRAGDWNTLHDFMQRAKEQDNTAVSFHVNLTDVNAGLRDYPETQAYFEKLVATKSIYCRDKNPLTRKRDIEPPYVIKAIPKEATDPNTIVSLVNFKNFYDSGLAKETIDQFYSHLPYPPPLLYVDVLMPGGANFTAGFPTGPLGGSEQTQIQGIYDIITYLNSKGSGVANEGDRPFLVGHATYGWSRSLPGISYDDYSYISGATKYLPLQHAAGDTGCFDVASHGATADGLAKVRDHYTRLLVGATDTKHMPGVDTWHICRRDAAVHDEFDIDGANGDPLRGDLADGINNFYLTGIQECYHIGNNAVRTEVFHKEGALHLVKFGITDPAGKESFISAVDCAAPGYVENAKKLGNLMIEQPIEVHFNAHRPGQYKITFYGGTRIGFGALNVYVNGELQQTFNKIEFPKQSDLTQSFPLGEFTLHGGDNTIAFDAGPIYMKWSDGTVALLTTPYLGKGLKVTNNDITLADDYNRMWPDTWSHKGSDKGSDKGSGGQKKIYLFSWDGTGRAWKLPADWSSVKNVTLYPLTPDGRGAGVPLAVGDRSVTPKLLPQIPYVLLAQ